MPDLVAPGMSLRPAQSPTPSSDCLRQYLSVMAFLLASELAAVRSLSVRRSSEDSKAASASASFAAWRDRGAEEEDEAAADVEATALSRAGIEMDSRPRAAGDEREREREEERERGWMGMNWGEEVGRGGVVGERNGWRKKWLRERWEEAVACEKNECSL